MSLTLEFACWVYGALAMGRPVLLSLLSPRSYEEARLAQARASSPRQLVLRPALSLALLGTAYLVASYYADLALVWLVLAIVLLTAASVLSFGTLWKRSFQVFSTSLESYGPPPEDVVLKQMKVRRLTNGVRFVLLAFWCYSWRHLFVGNPVLG